ncbi:hypothetical protein QU755_06745 [Pseudomonas wenzhouensis]|nr:hypothetical protein [Pseudomonas wenzhouensis]MDM9651190.1 hypothetical protein [Pseudomonas wenzhouensis]
MSQANPFEPLPQRVSSSLRRWPALPRQLAWVAFIVGVMGIAITLVTWAMSGYVDYMGWLRQGLSFWLGHLLLSALAAYWMTLAYLERHGLAGYPHPAPLMLGYGLLYLLASWAMGYALSYLFVWLYDNPDHYGTDRLLSDGVWWLVGLLRFAAEALLTLWLVLHLSRHKARPAETALHVSATTLAWLFAMGMVVLGLQLNALVVRLAGGMTAGEALDGWPGLAGLVNAGLCLLVSFFAARSALPAQVQGFNAGRLALACLITLLLWLGSGVPGAILMLAVLWLGHVSGPVMLVLLATLQLALLWPFTRLGLRWGYRAQAAQA